MLSGVTQQADLTDLLRETVVEGNELSISTNNGKIGRISISFQNLSDTESIFNWTEYVGENERPENEIGPLKYRTVTLSPKISDENEPVRRDKKEIVLNTDQADRIVIKVEKGKIDILVRAVSKKM